MLYIGNVLWLEAAAKRKLKSTYCRYRCGNCHILWKWRLKNHLKAQPGTLWSHPFETESGVFPNAPFRAPFRGLIGANGDQSFQLQSAVPDDQGPLQTSHWVMEKWLKWYFCWVHSVAGLKKLLLKQLALHLNDFADQGCMGVLKPVPSNGLTYAENYPLVSQDSDDMTTTCSRILLQEGQTKTVFSETKESSSNHRCPFSLYFSTGWLTTRR